MWINIAVALLLNLIELNSTPCKSRRLNKTSALWLTVMNPREKALTVFWMTGALLEIRVTGGYVKHGLPKSMSTASKNTSEMTELARTVGTRILRIFLLTSTCTVMEIIDDILTQLRPFNNIFFDVSLLFLVSCNRFMSLNRTFY